MESNQIAMNNIQEDLEIWSWIDQLSHKVRPCRCIACKSQVSRPGAKNPERQTRINLTDNCYESYTSICELEKLKPYKYIYVPRLDIDFFGSYGISTPRGIQYCQCELCNYKRELTDYRQGELQDSQTRISVSDYLIFELQPKVSFFYERFDNQLPLRKVGRQFWKSAISHWNQFNPDHKIQIIPNKKPIYNPKAKRNLQTKRLSPKSLPEIISIKSKIKSLYSETRDPVSETRDPVSETRSSVSETKDPDQYKIAEHHLYDRHILDLLNQYDAYSAIDEDRPKVIDSNKTEDEDRKQSELELKQIWQIKSRTEEIRPISPSETKLLVSEIPNRVNSQPKMELLKVPSHNVRRDSEDWVMAHE